MYDILSEDYDRFVHWPGRLNFEMPFLEKILGSLGRKQGEPAVRVLDAACGTGMHALALAQKGFEVSGADLSEGMIDRARQNAAAEGVDLPFAVAGFGDLGQIYVPASFDAVICLGNSLPHLISRAEVADTLCQFEELLAPGGVLLVQNRNFDVVMDTRQRWMEPQSHREEDREWIFVRFYDFQEDGLIAFNILTLRREALSDWMQSQATTLLRPQSHDELVDLAQRAGLEHIEALGSLDGSAFDAEKSGNLILLARKGSGG